MPTTAIDLPLDRIADFCRRWGISRMEVFGSILRDDFRPESDVDLLYVPGPYFKQKKVYGPWGHNCMAEELEELLGRKVDLIERSQVEKMDNWIKRRHILQTATPVYVD